MPHPFPHSTRILVADDSALERSRLASVVRALGLEPVEEGDSSRVIDRIRQIEPLLVLMDVVMPAPNGFELCRILQKDEQLSRLPIVMCSVKATEVDHMWAQRLGVSAYLAKPFDLERARLFLAAQIERIRGQVERQQAVSGAAPNSQEQEARHG